MCRSACGTLCFGSLTFSVCKYVMRWDNHLCDDQHVNPRQTESYVGPIFLHPPQHNLTSAQVAVSEAQKGEHSTILPCLSGPVQSKAQNVHSQDEVLTA